MTKRKVTEPQQEPRQQDGNPSEIKQSPMSDTERRALDVGGMTAKDAMSNDAPLPPDLGGVDDEVDAEGVSDYVPQEGKGLFYVRSKGAIINDEHHTDDDGDGNFGIVELSHAEAAEHRHRGVALVPVKLPEGE